MLFPPNIAHEPHGANHSMETITPTPPDQGQIAVLRSGDLLGVRDDLVTVCDRCLRATCWQGVFLCDDAYASGIVKKPRAELIALGREHADYIRTDWL